MSRLDELLAEIHELTSEPLRGSSSLSMADYEDAAAALRVPVSKIQAFADVEAGSHGAFLPGGHPVVLFERHLFHRFTDGRFDADHPDLSNKKPGGYGKVSAQPGRLARAESLDRDAARRATSWGLFQVLGDNWRVVGHDSLDDFVRAMKRSARDHLMAFVAFIQANNLARPLRAGDWRTVARGYNGPAYERHHYHTRLAEAHARFATA